MKRSITFVDLTDIDGTHFVKRMGEIGVGLNGFWLGDLREYFPVAILHECI